MLNTDILRKTTIRQQLTWFLSLRDVRCRRGTAAIEFAIGGMTLLLFFFLLIDLGDLAVTQYSLDNGVGVSARYAAVLASNAIYSSNGMSGATCPNTSLIQSAFDAAAAPMIPSSSAPEISVDWSGTMTKVCGGSSTAPTPGGWVTVSAAYVWKPLVFANVFSSVINLKATYSYDVMLAPLS